MILSLVIVIQHFVGVDGQIVYVITFSVVMVAIDGFNYTCMYRSKHTLSTWW